MPLQDDLLKELEKSELKHGVTHFVMEKVRNIVTGLRYRDIQVEVPYILVADFSKASQLLRDSVYFTDNCQVLIEPQPLIIMNYAWLLELEAALRSFNLADALLESQYLKSDKHMFVLVELIGLDPMRYLSKLRKLARTQNQSEEDDIVTQLALLVLFFICHEMGHLVSKKGGQFTSSLDPNAPLEQRIANAVIKLCRHSDEFAKYEFDLPGFFEVTKKESEIRQKEIGFRKQMTSWRTLYENVTQWFEDEIVADRTGTTIMLNYIKDIKKENGSEGDFHQFLLVKALFVAAFYSWYKDLHRFSRKLGSYFLDSRSLMIAMSKDRSQYIKVASLFGNVHRFTLLRSFLAIKSVLKADDSIPDSVDEKMVWFTKKYSDRGSNRDDLKKWWISESLKRYMLLSIIMDTAIKMAYMGCSTGWLLDVDEKRGTKQLFLMTFESIDIAVRRLHRIKSSNI